MLLVFVLALLSSSLLNDATGLLVEVKLFVDVDDVAVWKEATGATIPLSSQVDSRLIPSSPRHVASLPNSAKGQRAYLKKFS